MKHLPTALLAALAVTATAHAESVVFSADFNDDAPGLNTTPAGFNLTQGDVDLLGIGPQGEFFNLQPGNGYYVSLVGSGTGVGPGGLATDETFEAGEYELTFDLTGNSQVATDELVTVGLGSFSESIQLDAANAFDPFSGQSFTFTSDVAGALTFTTVDTPGDTDDQFGALIDNIVLTLIDDGTNGVDGVDGVDGNGTGSPTAVPTPSAAVAGLAMLGLVLRRRRA